MPPRKASRRRTAPQYPFKTKLVLNQVMLKLFGVESLGALSDGLKREVMEGLDENNVHKFCFELTNRIGEHPGISNDQLLEYDNNIVSHLQRINDRRQLRGEQAISWKYFQYLMLLFTEVYLDWYFRDPEGLLVALNEQIEIWNTDKEKADRLEKLDESADARNLLNKIAFWCATGSGKTLIMHTNILQFQFYQEKYLKREHRGRIILLTPNEGLSVQHIEEFRKSGLSAAAFDKAAMAGMMIEVIDINKLGDESGDKTVAVGAFEGSNLVLVDEGHRGASSGSDGAWMRYRNALCESGFSFEYSATFGQAVKGNKGLTNIYAKSIIFDYSYSYFYDDGFGKHYSILNLNEDTERTHLDEYLAACLLAFYQQVALFSGSKSEAIEFNIEKPLLVFVGSCLNA